MQVNSCFASKVRESRLVLDAEIANTLRRVGENICWHFALGQLVIHLVTPPACFVPHDLLWLSEETNMF